MTTKQQIRAEIERRKELLTPHNGQGVILCREIIKQFDSLLSFLDTLPDEEQPTKGCDDTYLNEKIAKASKSWEGVDVDKFMDEVRGREPVTECNDLEEAADEYISPIENDAGLEFINFLGKDIKDAFIAGAEWQKRKMIDDSYEEEVQEVYQDDDGIHCCVSVGTDYEPGTIVYVITIPKDEEK